LSNAAIANTRFFQEELDLVIKVSEERTNNFIMPVRIEDCDITASKFKDLHVFKLFPYEKQFPKLIQQIKKTHKETTFKKIADISPETAKSIMRFASLSYMLVPFMSDDIQPPKFNITFAHKTFPQSGGNVKLFGPDVQDQLLMMRQYSRQNNYRYTAFFVDKNGQVINTEFTSQKLKLKPVQLQLPENIAMVFIALGYSEDLEYAQKTFGKEQIRRENLLWAVFGDETLLAGNESSTLRPDHFKAFQSIMFTADQETNLEKRHAYLEDNRDTIQQAFDALIQVNDWANIGMMLKVLTEETKDSPISIFSEYQSHKICDELDKNKEMIEKTFIQFTFLRAKKLRYYAEEGDHVLKYTDRHRFIESAIRLIWNECDSDNNWMHNETISSKQAYQFIANCYLYRSMLALKKGTAVPEKKLEALNKAMEWANKANEQIYDLKEEAREWAKKANEQIDDLKVEAREWAKKANVQMDDLKVNIILEQSTWDDGFSINILEKALKDYVRQYKNEDFDLSKKINLAVVDKLLFILMDKEDTSKEDQSLKNRLDELDKQILNVKYDSTKEKGIIQWPLSFYKARSAFRQEDEEISTYLEKAVLELKDYLQTNIIWDETISIFKKVSENEAFKGKWEAAVISAWEYCVEVENIIKLPVQLRWYWSQYKIFYNLAFQAALNEEEKYNLLPVRIADSEKSRPTIKIQNAEKLFGNNEFFKLYVETDMSFFTNGYMANYEKLKEKSSSEIKLSLKIEDIPDGWSAIHFYIQESGDAHALILSSKTKQAIPVKLSIVELWKVFNRWHLNYRSFSTNTELKGSTELQDSTELHDLCLQSGKMLKPVLDMIDTDKVIFIPHGFLHLVPLHAAIIEDQNSADEKTTYFFLQKTCVYLPSWSIVNPDKSYDIHPKEDYFFSHWEPQEQLEDLLNLEWRNENRINNTPKEVIEIIEKFHSPPRLLTLFCHGKGDFMNPYNSKLALSEGGLTHEAIKTCHLNLKGTRVILTACETDFVAGYFGMVDEHLSLANAFLSKDAVEVLGSFFKYKPVYAIELIKHIKNNPDKHLYESLRDIQKQWATDVKSLSKLAAFRVMGLPKTGGKNNA
jgi:hypothetical protein